MLEGERGFTGGCGECFGAGGVCRAGVAGEGLAGRKAGRSGTGGRVYTSVRVEAREGDIPNN